MPHCLRIYLSFVSLLLLVPVFSQTNTAESTSPCPKSPFITVAGQTTLSFSFSKNEIDFSSLVILKPVATTDSLHVVFLSQFGFSLLQMTFASGKWHVQYQQQLVDQPGFVALLQSTIETLIEAPYVIREINSGKCKIKIGNQKYIYQTHNDKDQLKSKRLFIRKHLISKDEESINFDYGLLHIKINYRKIAL